jgi:nicotinate-nucleotide adenylyltransferase
MAAAAAMARRARIRASNFEQGQGTRYTIDTVRRLKRRYPRDQFVWLLGSDTLPNFHLWRDWRDLGREVPIAVIRRPGYDRVALAVRVMGWLRRFVRPSSQAKCWTEWSAPAILLLRLPRDPTSATAIRAHSPDWHRTEQGRAARVPHLAMPLSVRRPLDRTSH